MSDRVYLETQIQGAAIDIMRAAFQICPNCKNSSYHHTGQYSQSVFEFEEFTDRVYMSEKIVPAVIGEQPDRVLWVGVQVMQWTEDYLLCRLKALCVSIQSSGLAASALLSQSSKSIRNAYRNHHVMCLAYFLHACWVLTWADK